MRYPEPRLKHGDRPRQATALQVSLRWQRLLREGAQGWDHFSRCMPARAARRCFVVFKHRKRSWCELRPELHRPYQPRCRGLVPSPSRLSASRLVWNASSSTSSHCRARRQSEGLPLCRRAFVAMYQHRLQPRASDLHHTPSHGGQASRAASGGRLGDEGRRDAEPCELRQLLRRRAPGTPRARGRARRPLGPARRVSSAMQPPIAWRRSSRVRTCLSRSSMHTRVITCAHSSTSTYS
jgi:hypothetical protein